LLVLVELVVVDGGHLLKYNCWNYNGTANTGGGGGGKRWWSILAGGAGGSGVVILRMPTASYSGTTTGSVQQLQQMAQIQF
jgi:hypothetical protein